MRAGTLIAAQDDSDLSTITEAIDTSALSWWDYLTAVIILVSAVILGRVIRMVTKRLLVRAKTDDFLGDLIGRIFGYVVVAIGLVYALESLGVAVTPVLGALGIVGFAVAFALQDILENFVAGIILQLGRPFTAGDEIIAADHEGTVLEIDARTVTIRTPDGETVRLPSSEVIKNPLVNHTQLGRRRTTLDVGVAYDSDLDRAAQVALDAATTVDGVLETPGPEVFVHTFGGSSIDLAVKFWHDPSIASHWRVRDEVARSVAKAFDRHGIEIPFPQRVLHTTRSDDLAQPRPQD